MLDFELLKRTYPISQFDRNCDGYYYILDNTTIEQRKKWKINARELQRIIKTGEKYIYQVAKDGEVFKTMCLCFPNYALIRKYLYRLDDK